MHKRAIARTISLPLVLLASAGIAGGVPAAAAVPHDRPAGADCAPKTPPIVTVDRSLHQVFSHQFGPGWVGGDAAYSTALPDGREAFVFSDTVIGRAKPNGSANIAGLAHNSELVGPLAHLTSYYGGSFRSPRPLIPDLRGHGDQWQVASTYVEHGEQLVFVNEFVPRVGPFERFTGRSAIAALSLSADGTPTFQSITRLAGGPLDQWGNAVLRGTSFTYVYGSVSDTTTGTIYGMKVARVPRGRSLQLRAWRYWNGSRWVAGEAHAFTIHTGNELTGVTTQEGHDGYEAVSIPGSVRTDRTVDLSYSCSPQGPWSRPTAVYSIPQVSHLHRELAYIPTFHPELSGSSGIVVSFNLNTLDGLTPLKKDIHEYQPQFLRLGNGPSPRTPPTVVVAEDRSLPRATDVPGAALPPIPHRSGVVAHILRQPAELAGHLLGVSVAPLPMTGEDPGEPRQTGQPGH